MSKLNLFVCLFYGVQDFFKASLATLSSSVAGCKRIAFERVWTRRTTENWRTIARWPCSTYKAWTSELGCFEELFRNIRKFIPLSSFEKQHCNGLEQCYKIWWTAGRMWPTRCVCAARGIIKIPWFIVETIQFYVI